MARGFSTEQRLAFGRVARLYDSARPSYPAAALEEILAHARLAPGELVVEVGAGTGKLTRLLAERGARLLALEPDTAMAALARETCRAYPLVEVRELDFESYRPDASAALLVAAQSWHWVDPQRRYELAACALADGGSLAALWTLPCWERVELREGLRECYGRLAPDMVADFPMHPGSRSERLAGDWSAEISHSAGFADARVGEHHWSCLYSARDYAALLATHQDHILLDDERREQLLEGVHSVIEAAGGELVMSWRTVVCLARRGDRA